MDNPWKCVFVGLCFVLQFVGMHSVSEFMAIAVESGATLEDEGIEIIEGTMDQITNTPSSSLKIHTLNFNQTKTNIRFINAFEVDTFNQSLYFTETSSKALYRMNLDLTFADTTPEPEILFTGLSNNLFGLAFDWITKNIYLADANHGTITVRPAYTDDPLMHKTIIDHLFVPIGLTIDPLSGYLFWFTRRPDRIERALTTGDKITVVSSNSNAVLDLAVDIHEKQLYWIDDKHLVTSDYSGKSQRVIYSSTSSAAFTSIAVAKDDVCVVRYTSYSISCYDKITHARSFYRSYFFANNLPFALAIYDSRMQVTDQSEACKNHKCQHMCLIKSPKEGQCACKDGYKLKSDKMSCEVIHDMYHKGILFTNGSHILMAESRTASGGKLELKVLPDNIENATHLAADAKEYTIFFFDTYKKSLRSHNILTRVTDDLLIGRDNISDITYNYKTKDLYWIEDSQIGVLQVKTKNHKIPIHDANVFKANAFSITCAPLKRQLIWLDAGTDGKGQVYTGTMDGGSVSVFLSSDILFKPSVVEYDEYVERLFWVDNGKLFARALNATGISSLQLSEDLLPGNNILIYKRFVIWIDAKMNVNAEGYGGNTKVALTNSEVGPIKGMCLFDTSVEIYEEGPCDVGNGGCEYLCLPQDSKAVCECPLGRELDPSDQKSCIASKPMEDNFLLAADSGSKAIYQVSKDGQKIISLKLPESVNIETAEYSSAKKLMYVLDDTKNAIWSMKLDGTNLTQIKQLKNQPSRVTMDYGSGYLYYTVYVSLFESQVFVLDSKTGIEKMLFGDLSSAYGVAVYPSKGLLFVATDGILKASMDGSGREMLHQSSSFLIDGISIDYTADRLYWVDWYFETVETSYLNGSDWKVLGSHGNGYLTDIEVWGDILYYTGDNLRKIMMMDKNTKKTVSWMSDKLDIQKIQSVVAVPGQDQPPFTACLNNGGCSSLCLPNKDQTPTCACEDGDVLLEDGKGCAKTKPTCPKTIPNGELLTSDKKCFSIEGYSCDYKCNPGYRKSFDKKDLKIKCLSTGKWDQEINTLCEPIKCPQAIPFGMVNNETCDMMGNSHCSFTCMSGYAPTVNLISCTSSGYWNIDTSKICKKVVSCTETVKHGILLQPCRYYGDKECKVQCNSVSLINNVARSIHCRSNGELSVNPDLICLPIRCPVDKFTTLIMDQSCDPSPGKPCSFACKNGYTSVAPASVACLSTGLWSKTEDQMCRPKPCAEAIPGATLIDGANPVAFKSYSYRCNNRDQLKHSDIYSITCLPDGKWNTRVDNLCQEPKTTKTAAQTDNVTPPVAAGITAGAFVIFIIIIIVIVYIVLMRRKSHKAHFTESSRYTPNEFSNPAMDMQPTSSSVYDNIQTKDPAEGMKSSEEVGNPYHKF